MYTLKYFYFLLLNMLKFFLQSKVNDFIHPQTLICFVRAHFKEYNFLLEDCINFVKFQRIVLVINIINQ